MWSLVMGALVSTEDENAQDGNTITGLSQGGGQGSVDSPTSSKMKRDLELALQPEVIEKLDASKILQYKVLVPAVPERQQGDGMEVPALAAPQPEEQKPSRHSGEFPQTDPDLAPLPDLLSKLDLGSKAPAAPSQMIAEKPKVFPKGSYPPSAKKTRKAKFVPYEPYKGAVTPFMEEKTGRRRSCERKLNISTEETKLDASADQTAESSVLEENGSPDRAEMSPRLEENYRAMLDAKEKELVKLRQALQSTEKQFKIQTQVNSEIKKLLVASVGEDIEARVDFLTQDKARLAADVLHYNNKISRDWEEKEALYVESDIWRSKFLASSLILEEVTRAKQNSEARCQQVEHSARLVLLERNEIRSSLSSVQSIVNKLNISFDPLSRARAKQQPGDILEQTQHLRSTVQGLCDRLIGDTGRSSNHMDPPAAELHMENKPSQAELELMKILATARSSESSIPEQASSSLTRGARSLLLKMGDQAQSPHRTAFNTCGHCNGSVHIV